MNLGAQIFNKLSANCIQQYNIKQYNIKVIQHDQMIFIPRMQGWFNIHISINMMYHTHKKDKNKIVISSRKAFDKIKHPFIIKTLSKVGIGEHTGTQ